jgi:hypothetical protein
VEQVFRALAEVVGLALAARWLSASQQIRDGPSIDGGDAKQTEDSAATLAADGKPKLSPVNSSAPGQ